jgi:hypothetical protein
MTLEHAWPGRYKNDATCVCLNGILEFKNPDTTRLKKI